MPEGQTRTAAECRAMGASKKQDSFFTLRSFYFSIENKKTGRSF
jgi:hypothetical protein